MASMIAVQRDPMFKAYYEKKASEGLRYMNIIGHVTKKMTAVIYAIMRDNKAYVRYACCGVTEGHCLFQAHSKWVRLFCTRFSSRKHSLYLYIFCLTNT